MTEQQNIFCNPITVAPIVFIPFADPYEARCSIIHLHHIPFKEMDGWSYTTVTGEKLIDVLSAACTVPFGNAAPYKKALVAFLEESNRCPNLTPYFKSETVTAYRKALSKMMVQIDKNATDPDNATILTMKDLYIVSLGLLGSDSIDAAVKMAQAYTHKPGSGHIIAFQNSYHGQTGYSYSATTFGKKDAPEGFTYLSFPTTEEEAKAVLIQLEKLLSKDNHPYSALVMEIIQGDGGINVAPAGFFKLLQDICSRYNVITVDDEVQSGLGRTGKMFAFEHEGFIPDLIVIGKGFSGGVFPISAVIGKEPVVNALPKPNHLFSYSVHPGGCAAGLAVLDDMLNGKRNSALSGKPIHYMESNKEMGDYIREQFKTLQQKYPDYIKEVRGRGLMLGVEFNTPKTAQIVHQSCIEKGVLYGLFGGNNHVLRVEPNYMIDKQFVTTIIDTLDAALTEIKENRVPHSVKEKIANLVGLGE